jgi:hypothetical protein
LRDPPGAAGGSCLNARRPPESLPRAFETSPPGRRGSRRPSAPDGSPHQTLNRAREGDQSSADQWIERHVEEQLGPEQFVFPARSPGWRIARVLDGAAERCRRHEMPTRAFSASTAAGLSETCSLSPVSSLDERFARRRRLRFDGTGFPSDPRCHHDGDEIFLGRDGPECGNGEDGRALDGRARPPAASACSSCDRRRDVPRAGASRPSSMRRCRWPGQRASAAAGFPGDLTWRGWGESQRVAGKVEGLIRV